MAGAGSVWKACLDAGLGGLCAIGLRWLGWAGLASWLVLAQAVCGADPEWVSLFNGQDLSGWVNVNCAPNTWSVEEGMIVSTGLPTGMMRTRRQYENFELQVEWRLLRKNGNAGVFVWSDPIPASGVPFPRAIELQILDGQNADWYTSHGDVFAMHGAKLKPDRPHPRGAMRCLPSEFRSLPTPQWNQYHAICSNGVIKLAVNGKFVSGVSQCLPRKGYICLESEGAECQFRNLRIREWPASDPAPNEVAALAEGFRSLYTGVDLSGWKVEWGQEGHWQPKDWILEYDGQSEAEDKDLWTEKDYRDFVLIVDWRLTRKPELKTVPVVLPSGDYALNDDGTRKLVEVEDAGDSGIYLRGNTKSQVNIWCWPVGSGEIYGYREDQSLPPEVRAAVTPRSRADQPIGQWNRFTIVMKGDRVSVSLNGRTVIDEAQLPGVPLSGPIALQHHGDSIQFANLFIREL